MKPFRLCDMKFRGCLHGALLKCTLCNRLPHCCRFWLDNFSFFCYYIFLLIINDAWLSSDYLQVALHFWGTGGGALPVVAFLFLRDICIRLGSDCLDDCFRGIYKAYILNCHFINAVKLQHIQFLSNCVVELLGVDLRTAYQHAFVFIRQLAMILRDAFNVKTKVLFFVSFLRNCSFTISFVHKIVD